MALIDLGTADGSTIGNPTAGNYFLFLDSTNSDYLTRRDTFGNDTLYISGVIPAPLDNRIIVTQANVSTTLGGVIDSTKEYFIDGIIDIGVIQVTVPTTGITIKGYDFNISKLISSKNTYTMFTSPVGNSGDVLFKDFAIEVSGTNSKVYDLTDATGFNAYEISRINFNNCTSLGTLNGYRQGLETGTGYFGGTPNLKLSGTWLGGYFIDTSIVRGLTDGTYALYEEGTAFLMNSRFRSNQNIDLPASASFFDFQPSNFVNPSTVQLDKCLISRSGVFDANDTNIIPNMSATDLSSSWVGNIGIGNTFVGGKLRVSSESTTVIASGSTYYTLNATWVDSNLSHFDSPSSGELRHLGINPIEFKLSADFNIEGSANEELAVRLRIWRDATSSFVEFQPQLRQINSFVGGRDVAFFTILTSLKLNQNDYVYFQVANNSSNNNVTLELDSFFTVEER
tara:strand:- start:54 stop:1415 length:1362 start_codon:yes stop_codon:yes gene_type:complete